jgi:hypothetical protein
VWRIADFPPGFTGHPLLYLLTLFSMMLTVLLALEWLWRIGWALVERPRPLKHPSTVLRMVFVFLLVGLLFRIGPDAWLLMRWAQTTPAGRLQLEHFDSMLDTTSFVWMSLAWLAARLGDPFVQFQLEKRPIPVHLWPTAQQLRRPLYIGLGVFLIACALTFMR